MKTPAKVKLERIETGIFQDRFKHLTPRQADLNFEELILKFQERKIAHEEKMSAKEKEEEERYESNDSLTSVEMFPHFRFKSSLSFIINVQ